MGALSTTLKINHTREFKGAERVIGSPLDITGGVKKEDRQSFIQLHEKNKKIETLSNQIRQLQLAKEDAFKVAMFVRSQFIYKIDDEAESLSKVKPSELENSPYEVHMNKLNPELEARFLKNLKSIQKYKISVSQNVDPKAKLKALLDTHFENVNTLVLNIEAGFMKNTGSPAIIKAHAESILPPLLGIHDLRRQEDGFIDVAHQIILKLKDEIISINAK